MARLDPLAVWEAAKSVRAAAHEPGWVAVGGARELADVLARELGAGAAPGVVRVSSSVDGAAVLVYVLARAPAEDEERALRNAKRARVPIVVVLADPSLEDRVPHVLATDVVRVPTGAGFPVEEIARVVAHKLGEKGAHLAARVPVLRPAVCEELISTYSRRAFAIGAAVFVPGADMPVLTLNQIRLVLLLAAAYGIEVDRERVPEVLAVIASGLALRTVARQALGAIPVAGWAVKGAIAYAGTRAVGEAAQRYFEARADAERSAR